jgi:hypothetical protein
VRCSDITSKTVKETNTKETLILRNLSKKFRLGKRSSNMGSSLSSGNCVGEMYKLALEQQPRQKNY